jgi:two-component system sensor histidine kinase AtoS
VVAALCAALVARNLSRRLQRQLAPLVDAAERVAAGDFDTPLSIDAEGEIHYLALAQERMRLRLKRLVASAITVERRAVLGQFAAGVAHEIRNPLATIKATVQALARKEQSDDRRALMEMVSGEIDRASDVVQLMLDYANPPEVKPIEVDLQEVVETVRILTDATARAGDVTLRQAPGEPVRVMADPAQLRQILINLVMNAVEAMEGMGGTVDLVVRRRGLNAYVIVRDNGPGVTQQHLPYLAEPFFTTKMRGTGLGLAICTQLAQANEGKLVFRGASGKGLVAILQLPLLTNDDSERLHGNSIRSYN